MDCKTISLKKGATGNNVLEVQKDMVTHGYYLGAKMDSSFGPYMETEVIRLQKDGKLKPDGWFATLTCNYLTSLNTKKARGKWWGLYETGMNIIVNNAQQLFASLTMHGASYGYYYNDQLPNSTVLSRLINGGLVNCTDISQFIKRILEEMGYTVRFVRLEVKCTNGVWYGHVIVEFLGLGFVNWTVFDGSNKLSKHGNAVWGNMICNKGSRNPTINPAWLVNTQDNK